MTDSQPTSDYYVEIVQHEDGDTLERRGPFTERRAEKVDNGLNINLDHERFYTRIVRAEA